MEQLTKRVEQLEQDFKHTLTEQARMISDMKTLFRKLNDFKEIHEDIRRLCIMQGETVTEMKYMNENIKGMDTRIKDLERIPTQNWRLVVAGIIGGVVAWFSKLFFGG